MADRRKGRPRLEEPRDRQCNVSLTLREEADLLRRVALSGLGKADFARAALLAGNPSVAIRPEQPRRSAGEQVLDEEIRRMGVNLNQLVRHIHTHPDKALPPELQPLLAAIQMHLRAVFAHAP